MVSTFIAASAAIFGLTLTQREAIVPPEVQEAVPARARRASSARRGCGFVHLDLTREPGHGGPASCSGS
jgi:hypothetical protein